MAKIELAPGEEFEHYHSKTSATTLLEGQVELVYEGTTQTMRRGVTIEIPADAPHVIRNVGDTEAAVGCRH